MSLKSQVVGPDDTPHIAHMVNDHMEAIAHDANCVTESVGSTEHAVHLAADLAVPEELYLLGCNKMSLSYSTYKMWEHPAFVDAEFCGGKLFPFVTTKVAGCKFHLRPGMPILLKSYKLEEDLSYAAVVLTDTTIELLLYLPKKLRPEPRQKYRIGADNQEKIDLGTMCRLVRANAVDWVRTLEHWELMQTGDGDLSKAFREKWSNRQSENFQILKLWSTLYGNVKGASIRRPLSDVKLAPLSEHFAEPEQPRRSSRGGSAAAMAISSEASTASSRATAKSSGAAPTAVNTKKRKMSAKQPRRTAARLSLPSKPLVDTSVGLAAQGQDGAHPAVHPTTTTAPQASIAPSYDDGTSSVGQRSASGLDSSGFLERQVTASLERLCRTLPTNLSETIGTSIGSLEDSIKAHLQNEVHAVRLELLGTMAETKQAVLTAIESASTRSISNEQMERLVSFARMIVPGARANLGSPMEGKQMVCSDSGNVCLTLSLSLTTSTELTLLCHFFVSQDTPTPLPRVIVLLHNQSTSPATHGCHRIHTHSSHQSLRDQLPTYPRCQVLSPPTLRSLRQRHRAAEQAGSNWTYRRIPLTILYGP